MTATEVRPLRREEHSAAAAVACRALADSPTTAAIHGPDPLDGLAGLHGELAQFFTLLPSPQLGAVAGGCVIATAGVAPPGGCIGAFMERDALPELGDAEPEIGDPARARLFWAQWAAADPPEEHWHVGPVGVEPGYQGRGIGGAVMRELCAGLDLRHRLAWLETDKEANVRFYAGLGFEVAGTDTVLGVRTWYMRREPRAPGGDATVRKPPGAFLGALVMAGSVVAACGGTTAAAHSHGPRAQPYATTTTAATPSGDTIPTPAAPGPPGELTADGLAWRGHGDLAFVSDDTLYVLDDGGVLTEITGLPAGGGGGAMNPAWSPDGQWLAFIDDTEPQDTPGAPNDEPTTDSLWLVHAGDTVAHQVAPADVGQFAWSPAGDQLAFESETGDELQSLWTDMPGRPAVAFPGLELQYGGFAWSPDGRHLAVVTGHDATPGLDGSRPLSQLQVLPTNGGPAVTWFTSHTAGIHLDGWWPDGDGLLFWIDTGYSSSLAADGLELYSQEEGGSPRPLATTLVNPSWVTWSPDASLNTVALVAGGNRYVWGGDKTVETCDAVTATCAAVAHPAGTVALWPAWASPARLGFVVASDTGPFSPTNGEADFAPGWMAQWATTNTLYLANGQGPLVVPGGAEVMDAQWADAGGGDAGEGLLAVRDDALWLAPAAGTFVEVAGPLFSNAAPGGYYGQVAWASMFAWYRSGAAALP